jgi:hypothetical protein
LFHFRESLLRIRQEPLFLKKTAFDRTPLILLRISSVELCQRGPYDQELRLWKSHMFHETQLINKYAHIYKRSHM